MSVERIAVVTTSAEGRPRVLMDLYEHYIARQTRPYDTRHLEIDRECSGNRSMKLSLARALKFVPGGYGAVIIEDDDWYGPNHVECIADALPEKGLAGIGIVRQYHRSGQWARWEYRDMANMANTAIGPASIGDAIEVLTELAKSPAAPCRPFWEAMRARGGQFEIDPGPTFVGLKGFAGDTGISRRHKGLGGWKKDPTRWAKLREWIGDDCAMYEEHFA